MSVLTLYTRRWVQGPGLSISFVLGGGGFKTLTIPWKCLTLLLHPFLLSIKAKVCVFCPCIKLFSRLILLITAFPSYTAGGGREPWNVLSTATSNSNRTSSYFIYKTPFIETGAWGASQMTEISVTGCNKCCNKSNKTRLKSRSNN